MSLLLPLVLAGPILRRVEPNLVSVWIALSRPASITLTLWEGRTKAGAVDHLFVSDPATHTLRFGDQLHVAQALARIPAESEKKLKPGVVYSYDVAITEGATTHTLASLGLLKNAQTANGGPPELMRPHLALGYIDDFLPSFSLPPATLDDLRIVYGSCRRATNEHPDAMAMIDDLIADHHGDDPPLYEDALKRPHQLVLGGDQIYADDVWAGHLVMLNPLANELIGTYRADSSVPGEHRVPLETLPIEYTLRPLSEDEDPLATRWVAGGTTPLPVDLIAFPAGRRRALVLREAQMTTTDGESHLFSFGEFAAMYLMVWCNSCWPLPPDGWPGILDVLPQINTAPLIIPPYVEDAPDWNNLTPEDVDTTAEKEDYKACEGLKDIELDNCKHKQRRQKLSMNHAKHERQLRLFYAALPKIRRTLANVPTYMILDDHDVTDDWNLNPIWVDRVFTTKLGPTILRNALASYAVFQDWGNDPVRYLNERNDTGPAGDPQRMLETVSAMFPARQNLNDPPATPEQPTTDVARQLDHFFGLNLIPQKTDGADPPIKWHFSVPGPKHLLLALDNRTRRSFVSREGPPGNIAIPAQADQIPATLPPGCELLVVVAPLQVIGPGLLDELIAPAAYRIFDARSYSKLNDEDELEKLRKKLGLTKMEWEAKTADQKIILIGWELEERARKKFTAKEWEDKPADEKAKLLQDQLEKLLKELSLTEKAWNAKTSAQKTQLMEGRRKGTRRMIGTDPDAIEAWAFDPLALESLLQRLSVHRRVLLLSGDVHYSAANGMSYWTKGNAVPARIVQFTSSGFKNVMPWYIGVVDRVLSFAQRMIRSDVGAERMGWNEADDKAFEFADGNGLADVPPVLRRKLHQSPMLMPTLGWPDGTTVAATRLPDWSWRVTPTLDLRPDSEHPPPARPRVLEPDDALIQSILTDHVQPGKELSAYATIAARHQDQFDRLRHARQILFRSNFALVRFERAPDLTAVHEVYTALPDPDLEADAAPKPFAYMIQRASLEGRPDEVRPELGPFPPPAF